MNANGAAGVGPQPRSAHPVDEIDAIVGAVRAWVPPTVTVGARRIAAAEIGWLRPEEHIAARSMVPRRRAEFATGRNLLRETIGTSDPIPVGRHGAPELRSGIVASLAHAAGVAIAIATRDPAIAALGVDLEPAAAVTSDIADAVRRPDDADVPLAALFVAKEAAYKAWSTGGGDMLEPGDIRVAVAGSAFTAEIVASGEWLDGHVGGVGAWWAAVAVCVRGADGGITAPRQSR